MVLQSFLDSKKFVLYYGLILIYLYMSKKVVNINDSIAGYLSYLKNKIRQNLEDKNINATGDTSKSIEGKSGDNWGKLLASENLAEQETGSPPESEGGGWSYSEAAHWFELKGFEEFIWPIFTKVNYEGTQTFRNGGRSDLFTDELEDKGVEEIFLINVKNEATDSFFDVYIKDLDK